MKKFFYTFIILLLSLNFAQAQYQSLTLKKQKVEKKPFKLNVAETTAEYEPSDIGIIGMKYLHKPGSMSTVIEVYPHTPAQKAGIQIGDKLIEVNGVNIIPYDANQVFALIAGLPGVPLTVKLMRCNYYGSNCKSYTRELTRMDMNELNSDRVYRIYRYGN
jgi:C-terminal processing protease CtpA/Prc